MGDSVILKLTKKILSRKTVTASRENSDIFIHIPVYNGGHLRSWEGEKKSTIFLYVYKE